MKKNSPLILHPQLGQFRNYHFPPLMGSDDDMFAEEGTSYQDDYQNGFDDGQQKGHEQGYQEGLSQGIEAGTQQGLLEGRQQGVQQGVEQVRGHMSGSVAAVDQLTKQIETLFHQHVRDQSEMICDLVQKVARQVIRAELTLQPGQMLRLIEETLAQIPEQKSQITVFLNPSDCQRLIELMPDAVSGWELRQDESLATGSCRVISEDAEAIADTEERLDACMDAVRESLMADA
ncbi:flagellar assembly protein H [Enterovibrio makurazakiensis]|uniref:Flagellar assembly protein FliH n=1 Tax=Enterovibrio gelatinilyticus TaxID=2899819 RepID=A0ABT5QZW0_9GAMM|nr:flagellar assembly protein FliH [Enterovibrio sp. ZSDZ42]MDD1793550.1 flagellar assembly protein H [Enterovibrio sp. ZSDZ42]